MQEIEEQDYHVIVEDFSTKILYDGSQIKPHYVTKNYCKIGNSILVFRGGMKLSPNEMVDLKDILRESELTEILIRADDAVHMIIEEFDIQPPNIEIAYLRLRLLVQVVIEELQKKNVEPERRGTDIFVQNKKLNVGIATVGLTSTKIHFGMNITDTGIPSHVNAVGLKQLGFKEDELQDFIVNIGLKYIHEISKIKEDCAKTKPIW